MIKIELLGATRLFSEVDSDPLSLSSHAALECYQAETPTMGAMIDVEGRLFLPGHHTTLQHFSFNFNVEGISVGDVTLGLHLASPFYNSDQRSGRFCSAMFDKPDIGKLVAYVKNFWPEGGKRKNWLRNIESYLDNQLAFYQKTIQAASLLAEEFLEKERPMASEKYIKQNAPKIAQEQMRMFIPVLYPTGLDFTVNLSALVALWASAWTPVMIFVTDEMVKRVLSKYPELGFCFNPMYRRPIKGAGFLKLKPGTHGVKTSPGLKLLQLDGDDEFVPPFEELTYPVDRLHFDPCMMNNSAAGLKTEIEVSLATMGQDQRHRTIGRSKPELTGNFYLPPIPRSMGLEDAADSLMSDWLTLYSEMPSSLADILAPYGAMVRYKKRGSFNAVIHEQSKRSCFCAQEEIYHLSRKFRQAVIDERGERSLLLKMFQPPCSSTGKCAEGARYCGRDIKLRQKGEYFPKRVV